jgi:hypothetical protein
MTRREDGMTDDERFKKWGEWIMDIYEEEVHQALVIGHIRREVRNIIAANPRIQRPSAFYDSLARVYGDFGVMAVRRQVDVNLQSVSLARLLKEIIGCPYVLSRERFVGLYSPELEDDAHGEFDYLIGPNAPHIDPTVVQAELDNLREKTRDIKQYTNKRVAHYDKKGPTNIPMFQDIDDALSLICEVGRKYLFLLRKKNFQFQESTDEEDDWKAIFREPWIP